MKSQLIMFAIFIGSTALTASHICSCSELAQQADCSYGGCAWVTINGNPSCMEATVTSTSICINYTTQEACDAKSGCAWTNAGACAAFTKCSDYTIASTSNAAQCYLKDPTCVPGTASGTIVPCTAGTVTCSNVIDQNICSELISGPTSYCWWSTTCISQDVSKCTTITDESLCISIGCLFANGKCEAPTCASITIQSLCTYIRADDIESIQICTWANNVCTDAADTSALTSTTCLVNTALRYKWDGSACVSCSAFQCSNPVSGQVYNESLVIGNNSEPFIYYHQILILEQKMEKCEPTDKIINATLYLVQDNQKKQLQIKKANLDISGKASFEIYIENFWRNFSFLIEAGTDKLNYTLKSTTFDCVALSKENFNCPTCQQQCEETGINEEGCGNCVPEEYSFTTHLFFMVYFILLISL